MDTQLSAGCCQHAWMVAEFASCVPTVTGNGDRGRVYVEQVMLPALVASAVSIRSYTLGTKYAAAYLKPGGLLRPPHPIQPRLTPSASGGFQAGRGRADNSCCASPRGPSASGASGRSRRTTAARGRGGGDRETSITDIVDASRPHRDRAARFRLRQTFRSC
jgi:hypothetical protein